MQKAIKDLNIVAIGGGTGLSNLIRGLKKETELITAIVDMSDDGRSTGKLRKDYNVLAPGDVRNCIVALADEEEVYHKVFAYRFPHGRGLKGHNLGNLILLALEDITGSFRKAIQEISRILNIKGQVLPSTYEDVIISAKLANGRTIWGQSSISIAGHRSPIREIRLHPESAKANPDAVKAINEADVILIGPGSLYSSIIPNFLLKDITNSIVKSKAIKIYICNVSTERGETENYSVEDHVKAITKHSDINLFDIILANNKVVIKSSGKKLGEVKNISTEHKNLNGYSIISTDLISEDSPLYHDSNKLVKALIKIIKNEKHI